MLSKMARTIPFFLILVAVIALIETTKCAGEPALEPGIAIERLRLQGGEFEVDSQASAQPIAVVLAGKAATDAALDDIEALDGLEELSLCGQRFTDVGLGHLKKLQHLRRLELLYTQVTDAGLNNLKGLATLRELSLCGSCRVTNAGIRQLMALPALESLDLTSTHVTDQGVAELQAALPKLKIYHRYQSLRANLSKTKNEIQAKNTGRLEQLKQRLLRDPVRPGRVDDWEQLAVVLDEVLRVSPNTISAWEREAWNLAYNVSLECKDIQERYWWVKQGILVSLAGVKKNPASGRLRHNLAWTLELRIGQSDDAAQFRQLFANDEQLCEALLADFRRTDVLGPNGKPDSFLVARQWFLRAEPLEVAEFLDSSKDRPSLIFYSDAPRCQIRFAETIEKEGFCGDEAAQAWKEAERQWHNYGNIELTAAIGKLRLNDLEQLKKSDKPSDSTQAEWIRRYRDIVNFEVWRSRCRFEQLGDTLQARSLMYQARRALNQNGINAKEQDNPAAKQYFEESFQVWKAALARQPEMERDEYLGEELLEAIKQYQHSVLHDQSLPDDFPLKRFFDQWTKRASQDRN